MTTFWRASRQSSSPTFFLTCPVGEWLLIEGSQGQSVVAVDSSPKDVISTDCNLFSFASQYRCSFNHAYSTLLLEDTCSTRNASNCNIVEGKMAFDCSPK
jgi:hypothetical protein